MANWMAHVAVAVGAGACAATMHEYVMLDPAWSVTGGSSGNVRGSGSLQVVES